MRLGEGLRGIKATQRQATQRGRFELEDEWVVRIDDLRHALLRYKDLDVDDERRQLLSWLLAARQIDVEIAVDDAALPGQV